MIPLEEPIFIDVDNVVFVDQVGNNFLFRGPLPLTPTSDPKQPFLFNYDGLRGGMENALRNTGHELPWPYRLIDINLCQWENVSNIPWIETEYNYFQDHPDAGEFQFWETNGTGLCPLSPPLNDPEVQTYLATNLWYWLTDRLADSPPGVYPPGRMDQLREWLATDTDPPTVIYAHCQGGIDRTGELIGAYYLRWMGKTWAEMNCLNYQITEPNPRPFGCNNYRATLWYAIYLNVVHGFDLNYNEAFPCADPGGPAYKCGEASSNPDPDNPWTFCVG
ncbi:MAG TPA: hypothetical protein VE863_09560 [Pyrinomonadaceae bacterium]|nr:hypothetical protein [Pyrinomonadaceae bacterium]